MMKQLITPGRVRALLDGARTESEAADILRRHRIRYAYSTAGGALHIRIPGRAGAVTVTKTASRSAPLQVSAAGACYPYQVPLWTWND